MRCFESTFLCQIMKFVGLKVGKGVAGGMSTNIQSEEGSFFGIISTSIIEWKLNTSAVDQGY